MDSSNECRDGGTQNNARVRVPAEFPSRPAQTAIRVPAPSDPCRAISARRQTPRTMPPVHSRRIRQIAGLPPNTLQTLPRKESALALVAVAQVLPVARWELPEEVLRVQNARPQEQ